MNTDVAPMSTQDGAQVGAARAFLLVQTLPVGAGMAWEVLRGLSGPAQVLYAVLLGASNVMAYVVDDSPVPWPGDRWCDSRWARVSMESLARSMGCSTAVVARARRELEANGLLRLHTSASNGYPNLYVLASGGGSR